MTNEERQRTMDFIVEQQALFAAGIEKSEARITKLTRVVVLLARQFRRERHDLRASIAALVDAQIKTEEVVRQNGEDIRALVAASERREARNGDLDERIRALTVAAERRMERDQAFDERIRALTVASEQQAERGRELDERLRESHREFDERIRALAVASERNREDLSELARLVAQMARKQNGDAGNS